MASPSPKNLSPIAIAYQWVGRIFAVCVVMILPGVGGYWLDRYLGFESPIFAIAGFLLGLVLGMILLVVMATALQPQRSTSADTPADLADGRADSTATSQSPPDRHD